MKASFCIPATYRHNFLLKSCVERINDFSEKPDEIVISFSEVDSDKKEDYLRTCVSNLTDIPLKLIFNKEKKLPGGNRNVCIENSSYDLLIFADIDDVCRPDRFEIIKNIFKNNENVYHLTHSYVRLNVNSKIEVDNNTSHSLSKISLSEVIKKSSFCFEDKDLHNGAVSFLKNKIGNIRYKELKSDYIIYEDQDFNIDVLKMTNSCYFLDSKLYYYMIGFNTAGV